MTAKEVSSLTKKDPNLSRVLMLAPNGWKYKLLEELNAFATQKSKISAYNGCVLWGNRVINPEKGRD